MTQSKHHAIAAAVLVDRAKNGDKSAFSELVTRYRPRILALALHLTGKASDAEDISQDVFLQAFQRLHQFEGRSEFFTWLYRMAVNRSLNIRRTQNRRPQTSIDDPRVEMAVFVDAGNDPRRETELRRVYRTLIAALDNLPPELCTTLILVALQGFSHDEAAVIQNCAPGTIAWRIHEGRKRLRVALGPFSTEYLSPEKTQKSSRVVPPLLTRLVPQVG